MEREDRGRKRIRCRERLRGIWKYWREQREIHRWDYLNRKVTDHDWLFVYTGTETDIMSYVTVLILNPAFIFYGIIFVTGRVYNIILLYIIIDGITIVGWVIAALYQKKQQEDWYLMTPYERTEYIRKLIDSLDEPEDAKKKPGEGKSKK